MFISRILKKTDENHSSPQFEIHTIESLLSEDGNENVQPVAGSVYSLIWIQKGAGEIRIDLQKYIIEEDTVYHLKPWQALALEVNDPAKGFIISFSREFLELYEKKTAELINTAFFNPALTLPVIKLNDKANTFMKSIADEMLHEFVNYYDLRSEILKGFLKIFIIYLSRQFENGSQDTFYSRKKELVNVFFSQLENSYASKKMVKEYAAMLTVTPNYLNDTVKEISGFTASYHIQQRIILEAKRRAIFDGYNLKEIAYCLGFVDPSHFSKYFKNSSGLNFTDFKKGVSGYC
jgi:AraC family transcriptional regulator, transcriptional activator of pobA